MFNSDATSLDQIFDEFVHQALLRHMVSSYEADHLRYLLMLERRHQFQKSKSIFRSVVDLRNSNASTNMKKMLSSKTNSKWNN